MFLKGEVELLCCPEYNLHTIKYVLLFPEVLVQFFRRPRPTRRPRPPARAEMRLVKLVVS
jgi:hypothetical protein